MNTTPTIVVGVDGSWRDTGAVEWALDEAQRSSAPLLVVNVIDNRITWTPYLGTDAYHDAAERLVTDVRNHLKTQAPHSTIRTEITAGPPGPALAKISRTARLLVVGRRGLGSLTRVLTGSTSDAATHLAEVPVIVVPAGWRAPTRADAPVLVGIDDREPSHAALAFAFDTAIARGAPLRLVHAWQVPNVYAWDIPAITGEHDRWEAIARRRLGEIAEPWLGKYPEVDVQLDLRESHPVNGLEDAAASTDAQLLVVGGRPHSRVTGYLLGSVARGVIHHASCPVAVVHDPPSTPED